MKAEGSLGCSDHEFKILQGGNRAKSRTATLGFKRVNFDLFRNIIGGIPWARTLEGKGALESWLIFKHRVLQAQDRCIPMRKKSSKGGKRPAWMGKELLGNLKQKKKAYLLAA